MTMLPLLVEIWPVQAGRKRRGRIPIQFNLGDGGLSEHVVWDVILAHRVHKWSWGDSIGQDALGRRYLWELE
jgi:hypothetical protein